MSLTQDIANMVQAANNLTAEVAGKMSEIDQKTAQNTAKVDSELAKIQTKLPRIVMTLNQILKPADGQVYPENFSIGGGVTAEVYDYIEGNPASRDSAQISLLQEIQQDVGISMRISEHYRQGFYVYKLSWVTGNGSWFAFPRAADNPSLYNLPLNTFFTVGAFVKVLSGEVSDDAWCKGNKLGKWVFCNSKYEPSSFGAYVHLHPYRRSESGEVLVALPAAITGHIESGSNWFPNIILG
ncbi:hypothetical protein [Shewanella algae]|uniref:hypothetical protein n=1 Tax=Shewanella algae TaxID=38313 RepID=UPI0031F59698